MTEQEWSVCEDPQGMVKYLRGKASARKLRLFAVACCRWAWDWIAPPQNRQIVEEVERCVDQFLGDVGMGLAARTPTAGTTTVEDLLVRDLADDDAWKAADSVAFRVPRLCWGRQEHTSNPGEKAACQLLRDIVGNPFRPVTLDPACRTAAVVSRAQAAYEERRLPSGEMDPARLAVLADALENAGAAGELLGHLRGPGPHVRGCWVVDMATGRG